MAPASAAIGGPNASFNDKGKPMELRLSNMVAAKAISDAVRTSLGPRGMDKMIQTSKGETIITNDGATILKNIQALHPAAKMLVDLSAAQDIEAGDGTTSVVVLAGSLLAAAEKMLEKGIHPTIIAESFIAASAKAVDYLTEISTPIDLNDKNSLLRAASTSLNSKIVSQYSSTLAPIAVAAVTRLVTPTSSNVDLRDIRVVKKVGGTIEDTELVDGLVLNQTVISSAGGPTRIEKAKIAIIQFQLSAPKPDMDNTVVINDYRQMDKVIKEGRQYLLNMCKKIKKANCNVLLIQKSILRDAVDDTSLNFLKRLNILAIKDVERDEIDFLSKSLGCKPIADIEAFTEDKLGYADLVEETSQTGPKIVRISGIRNPGRTVSILAMGGNSLVVEECERSLHDALCVVRCLVKKRALIGGGGAPEIHVSRLLAQYAQSLRGMESYCFQAYADALEVIPTTLAENAGLHPIAIVTELRNRHALGERNAGINVRKGMISDILEEDVVQPLLVSTSAIELATETFMLTCINLGQTFIMSSLLRPNHNQLRSLVLDYLTQECFPQTAKSFADATMVKNINVDADGDEIMAAESEPKSDYDFEAAQADHRKEIRECILAGNVQDAIQLLEKHFPFVLSESVHPPVSPSSKNKSSVVSQYVPRTSVEPCHLNLNLRILAFTEACRTKPLPYPQSITPPSPPLDFEPVPRESLLEKVRKLYELAKLLPNRNDQTIYERELGNVCGLLAYPVPENSDISRYLSQERREAVAASVNVAILYRLGYPALSLLEYYVRYTTCCWSRIQELGLEPSPAAVLPPNFLPRGAKRPTTMEGNDQPFSLSQFVEQDRAL